MSDLDRDLYEEHRPLNFFGMLDSQLQGLMWAGLFGFVGILILWSMYNPWNGIYREEDDEEDDETIKNSTGGSEEEFWWGPSIGKSKGGGLRRSSPGIGKSKGGGWRRPKWRWWW